MLKINSAKHHYTPPLDSSLRWNDDPATLVIPGEQRETRNPEAQ